jgi:hypothetical protein
MSTHLVIKYVSSDFKKLIKYHSEKKSIALTIKIQEIDKRSGAKNDYVDYTIRQLVVAAIRVARGSKVICERGNK